MRGKCGALDNGAFRHYDSCGKPFQAAGIFKMKEPFLKSKTMLLERVR